MKNILRMFIEDGTKISPSRFYLWKRAFQAQNQWLVYSYKTCPRCKSSVKKERLDKGKCINYFCYNCQLLFRK